MVRLNSKPFFNENFDVLLLKLSRLCALVRKDDPSSIEEAITSLKHTQTRDCRTVKYWVHPDNVMELKLYVLKHLPVLLYSSQAKDSGKVDPRISSNAYLQGEPVMKKTIDKLRRSNELTSVEVDNLEKLAEQIQITVVEQKLKPILRTFYNRTAFQLPGESNVRITLDTEVAMIREDNYETVRSGTHWRRRDVGPKYPFTALPTSDIVRFPYAILDVKLEMTSGSTTPSWVDHLINSPLVEPVPNFSKYVHGVAALLENRVSLLPLRLPQMDKDIRRSPFRFVSQKGLYSKIQQAPSDDVRIDVNEIPFRRQTREDTSKYLHQNSLAASERTPLLGSSSSAGSNARPASGFFSIFRRIGASSSDAAVVRPTSKRIAVPVRVEPKVFFANERTFLAWLNFALVLGALAIALMNFGNWIGVVSGILFIAIALVVMVYALLVFQWRAYKIRRREAGPYDDRIGPIILVVCLFVAVSVNFGLKYYSILDGAN
ncbi:hypothetical protein L0F63_006021 [Massospora cicadina]|nr:hypothetical protein L0F63_006021 [Massospora cicadina]